MHHLPNIYVCRRVHSDMTGSKTFVRGVLQKGHLAQICAFSHVPTNRVRKICNRCVANPPPDNESLALMHAPTGAIIVVFKHFVANVLQIRLLPKICVLLHVQKEITIISSNPFAKIVC